MLPLLNNMLYYTQWPPAPTLCTRDPHGTSIHKVGFREKEREGEKKEAFFSFETEKRSAAVAQQEKLHKREKEWRKIALFSIESDPPCSIRVAVSRCIGRCRRGCRGTSGRCCRRHRHRRFARERGREEREECGTTGTGDQTRPEGHQQDQAPAHPRKGGRSR